MKPIVFGLIVVATLGCEQSKQPGAPIAKTDLSPSDNVTVATDTDQGHRASNAYQPTEQKNPTDEDITKGIQKLMLDSPMATNLGNVKVATKDGKVQLSGLVKTAEEKSAVEKLAQTSVGEANVYSTLEVE